MSDLYKLVFRGEVLEGQHPAVVRKRLAQAASFDEAALDKLFSGLPVVLKREADTATAARLQGVFKKAGARLRVLPVESDDGMNPSASPADPRAPAAARPEPTGPASPEPAAPIRYPETGEPELLPAGSDILRGDERAPWQSREIDTGDLALERARFLVPEQAPAPAGPDVSHLTLAEAGSDLGPRQAPPEHPVQAPELQVAEVGADLSPRTAPVQPAVDFASLQLEVAPAGADLGQRNSPPVPAAPDTSHLSIAGGPEPG